jgi:hypothetical protein
MALLPNEVKESNKITSLAEQKTSETIKKTIIEASKATSIVILLSAFMALFIFIGSYIEFIKENSVINSLDFLSLMESLFGIGVPAGLGAIILMATLISVLNLTNEVFSAVLNISQIVIGMCVAALMGVFCLAVIKFVFSSSVDTSYLTLFAVAINYIITLCFSVWSSFNSIEMRNNKVKDTKTKKMVASITYLFSAIGLLLTNGSNNFMYFLQVVLGLCTVIVIAEIITHGKNGIRNNKMNDSFTGGVGLMMATIMFAYLFYLVCTSPFDTQEFICNSGWLFTETCDLLKAKS